MWRIFRGSGARAHSHNSSSNAWSWQGGQATDPELALPGPGPRITESSPLAHAAASPSSAYASTHTLSLDAVERPSPSSRAMLVGFLLLMLVVSLLPNSCIVGLGVVVILAMCRRAWLQLQSQSRRPRSAAPAAAASPRVVRVSRIADNSAWVVFHRDQPVSLDALNAQLSLISRDFNSTAFSVRAASEQQPRSDLSAEVLSDSEIAVFPVHQYRRSRQYSRQRPAAALQHGGSLDGSVAGPCDVATPYPKPKRDGKPGALGLHGPGAAELQFRSSGAPLRAAGRQEGADTAPAAAGPGARGGGGDERDGACDSEAGPWTCVVCLDPYKDGEHIMTLPCMHHFHQACLVPWLKHQGKRTSCPMCKTPCFP